MLDFRYRIADAGYRIPSLSYPPTAYFLVPPHRKKRPQRKCLQTPYPLTLVSCMSYNTLCTNYSCTRDICKVLPAITDAGRDITRQALTPLQCKLSASFRSLPELEQSAIAFSFERVVKLMEAEHLDAPLHLLPDSPIAT